MPNATGVPGAAGDRWTPSEASMKARDVGADDTIEGAFASDTWAGFWRRWFALVIDTWIVEIFVGIAAALLVPRLPIPSSVPGGKPAVGLWTFVFYILSWILYQAYFLSRSNGSTPGRKAMGIAVVDHNTGKPIGFFRAIWRGLTAMVCMYTVLPEGLQIFTIRRQSGADLVAGTVVVRSGRASGALLIIVVIFMSLAAIGILAAVAIPQYQRYVQHSAGH